MMFLTKFYQWVLDKIQQRRDNRSIVSYDKRVWYLHGQLHRKGGPSVEYTDGTKYWYLHGELHRSDGPAVEWADGGYEWWVNGQLHRTDGPAVEWADGTCMWYLNGYELTETEWNFWKEIYVC